MYIQSIWFYLQEEYYHYLDLNRTINLRQILTISAHGLHKILFIVVVNNLSRG